MPDIIQVMVLPTSVTDGLPQVLFDDGGIWRETLPLPVAAPQNTLRDQTERFLRDAMTGVGQKNPVGVPPNRVAFRTRFMNLLRTLLPAEVRDAMKHVADAAVAAGSCAPQLHVFFRAGTEWIPWELLHDGTDYLGTRFAIARLPILPQATEMRPPRNRDVRKVYSLLARDVLPNEIVPVWQTTFDAYRHDPAWECRFPSTGADNYPTLGQLEDACEADVVHVTCHGGLKDEIQNEYFWTLDEKSPQPIDYRITPVIARGVTFRKRPLVFGNACASASADLASLQGFGASFMVGGALNFVGTLAPISKSMAVDFAKRFYARLFGDGMNPPLPIGEALRATKASFAAEACTDPSYLFYCLYGPCDSTYVPQ